MTGSSSAFTVGGASFSGALVYLGTQTANVSSLLQFTNIFSSNYTNYVFVFNNLIPSAGAILQCQLGTGSTPTYVAANYNWQLNAYVGSGSLEGGNSTSDSKIVLSNTNASYPISSTVGNYNGQLWVSGTNGTSAVATGTLTTSHFADTSSYTVCNQGNFYQPAAVFTSIKFYLNTGTITSGSISVYGIAQASGNSGGTWTQIASQIISSGAATVSFTNTAYPLLFSNNYGQYVITFTNVLPATNNKILYCQLGTGGTPTYVTANYNWVNWIVLGGSNYNQMNASDAQVTMCNNNGTYGIDSTVGNYGGQMWITGASGSSNVATVNYQAGYTTATTPYAAAINGSFSQAAAVFTAIKFYMSSGNFTSGTITIYGVGP